MVGEAAARDAVERARCLPDLRVGLHLVVVRGRPVLPPEALPDLVGRDGRFSERLLRAGLSFFFRRRVRAQLEAEIRAQFEAFRATGLALDHVNAHSHMHLHPTILSLILAVGRDYGLRALRVPDEPSGGLGARLLFRPLLGHMRRRLKASDVKANDRVFGLRDSGRMTEARVRGILERLPGGVSEIYFHPATGPWPDMPAGAEGYEFEQELAALISPRVAEAVRRADAELIGYGDL